MEATSLPEALKLIMKTRDWRQSDLARELGVSQAFISQLINGKRDLSLAKLITHLSRVGWEVRITPEAEKGDAVERREFTTKFLPGAASIVFLPAGSPSPFHNAEYVRGLADSLASRRYELGGVPLAADALGHLNKVRRAVASEQTNTELTSAATALVDQVALVLYDAGRTVDAEKSGLIGLKFADLSSQPESRARAFDTLSRVVSYRGDWGKGVMYARHGLSVRDISDSQRASLCMRLGRALAPIRDQKTASHDALESALSYESLTAFSRAALIGDVGIGFGHLQQYERAGDLLGEAAAQIGRWSPLFQAQYVGRQTQTALRAANPTLAAIRMRELAYALPFVSSARMDMRVTNILSSSKKWSRLPAIREAREYLQSVAPHNTTQTL